MSANLVQLLNQYVFEYTNKETGKVVKFKPITTGQMKTMLSYEDNENIGAVDDMLDSLIKGCVVSEDFNIDTFTIQDRFDLLLEIRKKSKGEVYTFTSSCSDCNGKTINSINLDKLEVRPFPQKVNKILKINDNLSVELDFLRRGYQKEVYKDIEEQKGLSDKQKTVEVATALYAMSIRRFITPQGDVKDVTINDKKDFLNALSGNDYEKLGNWFIDNDYGTVFKYKVKCHSCKKEEEHSIPITSFFS